MEFFHPDELMAVFGPTDANVSLIDADVSITARDKSRWRCAAKRKRAGLRLRR